MEKKDLKSGQRWYVKLHKDASTLAKREIIEITKKTVTLEDYENFSRYNEDTYSIDDIEFIEMFQFENEA